MGQQQSVTRVLLWAGAVGPALFVAVVLIAGASRAGYDANRHFISLLSLGDGGLIQALNFLVSGALIVAFAAGMRRVMQSGPACRWAPRAIGVVGIGLMVAGVFQTDPGQGFPPGAPDGLSLDISWHAGIHYVGAVTVFWILPVAAAFIARRAWYNGQKGFAIYSVASGLAMLALDALAIGLALAGGQAAEVAGLVQRLSIVSGFQWLTVFALLLLNSWRGLNTSIA